MVFDYYVDDATCSMVPWEGKVPSFSYMPDSFSSLFVPTVDTTRLTYFLDTLVAKKHYVMFVGNTGELIICLLQPCTLSLCSCKLIENLVTNGLLLTPLALLFPHVSSGCTVL